MQFSPLTLIPGVKTTPTKTSRSANWQEVNLMRWVAGKMRPVGGWEKLAYDPFPSDCRATHTWSDLAGREITAYLCEQHVFVDLGDGLVDISPEVPLSPPVGTNSPGGYGDYTFNYDTYGTERPERENTKPLTSGFYADNWGQNLIIMTSADGRMLEWDPSVLDGKLVPVENAPTGNRAFVITPQRHILLFGAGGVNNRFAWCSQEDNTDWNYTSVTNTAGYYDFQPMASVITACRSGSEVVFWTTSGSVFVIRYIGVPFVFAYDEISTGSTPVSPASVVNTPMGAVWFAANGPWRYEANSVVPISCDVWPWVVDHALASAARFTSAAITLDTFSEIWWFFPSTDSDKPGNHRYIQWNYKEGWWSQGTLSRLCGSSSTYTRFPIMSDGKSVYRHESGNYYGSFDENNLPWAKTFNLNVNIGQLGTFNKLLPDIDGDISALVFQLEYNIPRAGALLRDQLTPEAEMLPSGYVPFRHTGRDFRVIVKQKGYGVSPWAMGETGVDITPRGEK